MSKTQLVMLAATIVTALVADFDAFMAAKKADPNIRWEWWPFVKRLVLGAIAGLTGGAGIEIAGP